MKRKDLARTMAHCVYTYMVRAGATHGEAITLAHKIWEKYIK